MCIKKRLGKYRNSDQQFNTCSALSCIYWTADAIINSALFFHNACECTCPDSTLEYGKTVRAIRLTLAFMNRRGKKSYLDRQVALFVVRKGVLETRVQAEEPLSSATNTNHTALTQPCTVRPKKPGPAPAHPREGSVIPGATTTHTCVTETRAPTGRVGRQDLAAGM